jgi:hypothetical protein
LTHSITWKPSKLCCFCIWNGCKSDFHMIHELCQSLEN